MEFGWESTGWKMHQHALEMCAVLVAVSVLRVFPMKSSLYSILSGNNLTDGKSRTCKKRQIEFWRENTPQRGVGMNWERPGKRAIVLFVNGTPDVKAQ